MKRTRHARYLLLAASLLLAPFAALAASVSLTAWPSDGILRFEAQEFRVPAYFPYPDALAANPAFYARLAEGKAAGDYEIIVGLTPDCDGQQVCGIGSFSFYDDPQAARRFIKPADRLTDAAALLPDHEAYFLPSTCGANCSPATLVAIGAESAFRIEARGTGVLHRDRAELLRAARSFLKMPH